MNKPHTDEPFVRISSRNAQRELSEMLGRVRYARERFLILRHGKPVALLIPMPLPPEADKSE